MSEVAQSRTRDQVRPHEIAHLRSRYLETLRAEQEVREEFEAARKRVSALLPHPSQLSSTDAASEDVLLSRINASRQRKVYAQLNVLSGHLDSYEALLPTTLVFETDSESSETNDGDEVAYSRQRFETLVRELETDVVKAKMDADRERSALDAVKEKASDEGVSGEGVGRVGAKMRALEAVRKKLTRWIEESLAACGQDQATNGEYVNGHYNEPGEQGEQVSANDIEDAYEEYIVSRRELVAAVEEAVRQVEIEAKEEVVSRDQKGIVLGKDNVLEAGHGAKDLQHERTLSTFTKYATGRLAKEEADAAETLERLADESQLLPAYPMLASSGRFGDLAARIGSMEKQKDPVPEQIEAWAFAAEAAASTNHAVIERDVKRGDKALDDAAATLKNASLLHSD